MPKLRYQIIKFNDIEKQIIARANDIIRAWAEKGLDLTLRQLYYQFVARDWFPQEGEIKRGSRTNWIDPATGSTNNERSYDKLGVIIGDARLAGLIDWNAIGDRTRNLRKRSEWKTPADLIGVCAESYRIDRWANQPRRPEVWIEKDALVGVVEDVCERNGVAYFSCRGYTSLSEVWVASQRLLRAIRAGQRPCILHFGDHDPSGIDMTRDIEDRLRRFVLIDLYRAKELTGDEMEEIEQGERLAPFELRRLALNMDQIRRYNPPPNPAKVTDSRAGKYIAEHGDSSWELDALNPDAIIQLVEDELATLRDDEKWKASEVSEEWGRDVFVRVKDRFDEVCDLVGAEEPQ